MNASEERIVRLLLAIAAVSSVGLLIFGLGWYRATSKRPDVTDLSQEVRQTLVQELIESSPGLYRWTWFEPRIGYTLVPNTQLTAWNDTFVANELGFRTGPPVKQPGTFRVVFVGDSWTYGMGISQAESFPEVFAGLANRWGGQDDPVEAWTMALPGYNLLSGLAALDYFFERLQPDAVVICPSGNDNHTTPVVLPNGSLGEAPTRDAFGDPHNVTYRQRQLDSYRFRERWRVSYAALHETVEKLRLRQVPVLLAFVARWEEPQVHTALAEAGIATTFFVVPPEYTIGRWEGPPPVGHGNAAAQQLYGRWVYRALAHTLTWPDLPANTTVLDPPIYDQPTMPIDNSARTEWADWTRDQVPLSFRPGEMAPAQKTGLLDGESGAIGRATTILVRSRADSRSLRISVRRIVAAPSLYPLPLTVSISSPNGGTSVETVVPSRGPEPFQFEIDIPSDLRPGSALDVVLEAERSVASSAVLTGRSLIVESIENVPSH